MSLNKIRYTEKVLPLKFLYPSLTQLPLTSGSFKAFTLTYSYILFKQDVAGMRKGQHNSSRLFRELKYPVYGEVGLSKCPIKS